jgi:hypothetical protein
MRPRKEDQICTRQQKKGENKSPDTSVRSVFCQREEWVASDPRQDTTEENQVCIRQQNRGENSRPDTSMRLVWYWREAGASSARFEKDATRRIKDVDNRRAATMRDPTPWCVH